MAEQFKFGEAIVELITDPHHLIAGFKQAEAEGKGFVGKMQGALGSFASIAMPLGVTASIVALGEATLHGAEHVAHLSEQVGVSVEDLTRLQYAARGVHLDLDDLTTGLKFLSKQMIKGEDDIGKPSKALERLGIKSTDASGHMRGTIQVLLDVADKFAHMEDGANKTATAVELFGRSGIRMIPILNKGRAELEEMAATADRLGITLTTHAAESAAEFQSTIRLMGMQVKGAANDIVGGLAPALSGIANELGTGLIPALHEAGETSKTFGKDVADDADPLRERWHEAGVTIGAVATVLIMDLKAVASTVKLAVNAIGDIAQISFGDPRQGVHNLAKDWETYGRTIDVIGDEGAASIDKLTHATKGLTDASGDATDDNLKKANRALEIAILGKKQDIAGAMENTKAEEMYAQALDKVAYQTAVDSGASETLAHILMDLSASARQATRDQKAREEQEKENEKAAREAAQEAKRRFAEEGRLYEAKYRLAHQLMDQQFAAEKDFESFMHGSRTRVTDAMLTGYQKEVAAVAERYRMELEHASEAYQGTEMFNQAKEQAELELTSAMKDINERYSLNEADLLQRRIHAHMSAADQIAGIEMGVADDMQRAMDEGFFDLISGRFNDLDDAGKRWLDSLKHRIAQFLEDQVMKEFEKWLLRIAGAWLSKFGSQGMATAGAYQSGSDFGSFGAMAGGGIIPRRLAGGEIAKARHPHLAIYGEGQFDEAVIPMPNGVVEARIARPDRSNEQPFQIQQSIKVVVEPAMMAAMKTSPDEVIAYIGADYRRGGLTFNLIHGTGRR